MTVYSSLAPLSDEITSADLLAQIPGLTYRQLDWWARNGYLRPNEPAPGSGIARTWNSDEFWVAHRMARLVCVGFSATFAAQIARRGPGAHDIGAGIVVEVVEVRP